MNKSLQQQFLESHGAPVTLGELTVIQMDRVMIPVHSTIEVTFVGEKVYSDCAAVLGVSRKGKIKLSDGTYATAVAIWDQSDLPRVVNHEVIAPDGCLQVYNKYRVQHPSGLATEESFTGNAGMVVTDLGPNVRLYECSKGPGSFDKRALVFKVSWAEFQ
ncbi:MAG TPA: hypothetical protein VFA39_02665 [Steroidobacteraceae bacterium]|nr:hypothetical protein [Steroidobacteraceae bacterium]